MDTTYSKYLKYKMKYINLKIQVDSLDQNGGALCIFKTSIKDYLTNEKNSASSRIYLYDLLHTVNYNIGLDINKILKRETDGIEMDINKLITYLTSKYKNVDNLEIISEYKNNMIDVFDIIFILKYIVNDELKYREVEKLLQIKDQPILDYLDKIAKKKLMDSCVGIGRLIM